MKKWDWKLLMMIIFGSATMFFFYKLMEIEALNKIGGNTL